MFAPPELRMVDEVLEAWAINQRVNRGGILLTLKQSGHNVDKAARYAIWNWDRL